MKEGVQSSAWPEKISLFTAPIKGWEKRLHNLPTLTFANVDRFLERTKTTSGGAGENGKASHEGWIMFREEYVRKLEVANISESGDRCSRLRASVCASYRVTVTYRVDAIVVRSSGTVQEQNVIFLWRTAGVPLELVEFVSTPWQYSTVCVTFCSKVQQ